MGAQQTAMRHNAIIKLRGAVVSGSDLQVDTDGVSPANGVSIQPQVICEGLGLALQP